MNLDDLGRESISEMSLDEAIELLRQIRLSRRTPPKKAKSKSTKKKSPSGNAAQAAQLLKLLGGLQND